MRKIILILLTLTFSIVVGAQSQQGKILPIDPNVRYGKLENGLTYYIRHNKYPEKRADFYIAQKVGSMQEEDNQAGLAHFLEHMAFNGTKHFPGRKTMLNYMETIGARFGANVNAYTGFDETVYILNNIPVVRQAIIDSCLLVLHDWSGYISLDNDEIDKERPIIKEEWRTRSGSSYRIMEKQLPVIYKGSKYADRMPIGKMEVVENFEYQVIKDYYKKWYRPDLQAIIVVGDIDADKIETQIKEMFSSIPMPKNPAERVSHPVPDNKEPIISIVGDKEETSSRITYYIKHDLFPQEVLQTEEGYVAKMAISLAANMLASRLSDISKTAESPFIASTTMDGNFFVSKSKNAWTSIAISKEGKEKETLASLLRETERVKQYGFTDSELERTKANYLSRLEQVYNNRDKRQNETFVKEYVRSFTDGEPIPGIEYEYELVKRALPSLTASVINQAVAQLITEDNNVITITGPEKEGFSLPTEDEVKDIIKSVKAEDIEGYMEEIITEPLISNIPEAGKIVKEEQDTTLGITIWTLSNGMKIGVKPTKFKDDEIMFSSITYGGISLSPNATIHEAALANYVPFIGGIGNFNSTNLKKVLAGKTATISPSIQDFTHGFGGRTSVKDLETLLQLTYLHFTAPRKDEGMFENLRNTFKDEVKNSQGKPSTALQEYLSFAKYGYNPRFSAMTVENVMDLNYDAVIDFYKTLYANPSSFVFSFVGNVDLEQLKPLVETYLASLPAGDPNITYNKDNVFEYRKGKSETVFEQIMVEPKTTAYSIYSAKMPYNAKIKRSLGLFSQILDIVYTRTIREEAGGTYGVRASAGISRIPEGQAVLNIMFDTDPERVKILTPMVHAEIEKLAENGPEAEDFQKVKEYSVKKLAENKILNHYWIGVVLHKMFYGEDNDTEALELLQSITPQDIQNVAKEFISQGNLIDVIMNPLPQK